jgi:hypothetical protein
MTRPARLVLFIDAEADRKVDELEKDIAADD